MIPRDLLLASAVLLAALLLASWAALLLSGTRAAYVRRVRRRRHDALVTLSRAAVRMDLQPTELAVLQRLPMRDLIRIFASLAPNLRGRERRWLSVVARRLGLARAAARHCRSRLWWRRVSGARLLTLIGRGRGHVLPLARDPHPLVRAQVAEWAGSDTHPRAIRALLEMLGDPAPACRFTVEDALLRLGRDAALPLAERLRGESDPIALLAGLRVARALADPVLLPVALATIRSDDPQLRAAAARVLGAIGGSAAPEHLRHLLTDTDAGVRSAAAGALGDLGNWSTGPALAARLRDPDWDVRSAAAGALARLGPPGVLLLRGAARSEDRFAADMARLTLETTAVTAGPRRPL